MGLCFFIKVVKLLSQLMGSYQVHSLESWCPSRFCFESTFIYHGNGYSDRRREGSLINGVVVCRRSCFVWGQV